MTGTKPDMLRENAPLFGVVAILLSAFAALAVFAPGRDAAPAARAPAMIAEAPIAALPATPEEDRTLASVLDPEDARARNAAVPVEVDALSPARPFAFRGSSTDRTRARDCLALAAMAEAGGGDKDQRAVMQVVVNRARHPAFADTICGVVFEGSQRPTGCQFTFTCDGSLARRYPDSEWQAARARADDALDGYVHRSVGTATHYHADYVYPYWSPSLDKVAVVGPHLFFRWKGPWGTARAFTARYAGGEPDPVALRSQAQAVERPADLLPQFAQQGTALRTISAGAAAPDSAPGTAQPPARSPSPPPGVHFVLVAPGDSPATLVERARALCPGERFCQVYGWSDPGAVPANLPLSGEARQALRFSFLPARAGNPEVAYVDCRILPASEVADCLPRARP